jgi:hypothetical protein
MNEMFKTMNEIQSAFYENWRSGATMYYKTWIEPFFNAFCKDVKIGGCKCKCD